ncbi:MAG TPA: porin PorA family protein [Aldersonia sp.]
MVVGIVSITLAALVHFVLTPALTKLPADTDSTAHYTGTATMLNAKALAAKDTAHAIAKDVPITMDRHVFVTTTAGDSATVQDDVTLNVPGTEAKPKTHVYTMDRGSLQATGAVTESGATEPISGLLFTLPLHPKAENYSIYDSATEQTVPLKFTGTGDVSGRATNTYEVDASGPLQDEATLQTLPPALPKALIGQIMPLLPAGSQQALTASMDALPDSVPLSYVVTTQASLAADQTLGAPLDSSLHQTIVATIDAGGNQVPLLPVADVKVELTDDTVAANVGKANEAAQKLNVVSTVVPLTLLLLGNVLFVVGFKRRRQPIGAPHVTTDDELSMARD